MVLFYKAERMNSYVIYNGLSYLDKQTIIYNIAIHSFSLIQQIHYI